MEKRKCKQKIDIITLIEIGLNFLAQDMIWDKYTERDLQKYVNQFKILEKK